MTNTIDDLINGRCFWCGTDEMYVRYHDREWGRPVHDDTRLFEKVCLEGFQSGLSWYTILKRREGFRAAFQQFDLDVVAAYTDSDVEQSLHEKDMITDRG